jgi:hypothetical protein
MGGADVVTCPRSAATDKHCTTAKQAHATLEVTIPTAAEKSLLIHTSVLIISRVYFSKASIFVPEQ